MNNKKKNRAKRKWPKFNNQIRMNNKGTKIV